MIYGWGINDVPGDSTKTSDHIHIYNTWTRMVRRCYDKKYQIAKPSYIGTVVCEEWKYYSNFREWYISNHISGYELDKDIIGGSKSIYSPDTCAFVPTDINNSILMGRNAHSHSVYPLGVSEIATTDRAKPFCSEIYQNKKKRNLGYYYTPEEAHVPWQREKVKYFEKLIEKYKNIVDSRVIDGLQRRIDIINDDIKNGRLTSNINKI